MKNLLAIFLFVGAALSNPTQQYAGQPRTEYYYRFEEDIMLEPLENLSVNMSDVSLWKKTQGLVYLHGLGPSIDLYCGQFLISTGLSLTRTRLKCPRAPKRGVTLLPPAIRKMLDNYLSVRSWFDFSKMPEYCVKEDPNTPCENAEQLKEAFGWVEREIEELIHEGIPKENIIVAGMSQGGALALYTAIHSKFKIGAFIPHVTWLPLATAEPPSTWGTPVNQRTPIFHMNGNQDLIVPFPAGKATFQAMDQVFANYVLNNMPGTHLTTSLNPVNMPTLYCWIRRNMLGIKFSSVTPWRFWKC